MRRNFFRRTQERKWRESSYHNPYFEKRSSSWRGHLKWLVPVVGFVAVIGFVLWTPLLRIQEYLVEGTEFIEVREIEASAREALSKRRFFVIPKDHILFFSERDLSETLFYAYRIDRLEILRRGRRLTLRISEKISRVVWKSGEDAYIVDENGVVASQPETPIEEMPLIVIETLETRPVAIGEQVIDPVTMGNILELLLLLRDGPLEPSQLEIDSSEANFLRVRMADGSAVFFDPTSPLEPQMSRLIHVLQNESADPASYEYIDVRFGERVYIKDR